MAQTSSQKTLKEVFQDPRDILAFGFGSGLAPVAPGTFGTVAAIPVYIICSLFHPKVYLVLTIIAFLLGIYVCGRASKALGVDDHPSIVWDEITGYLLTMFLVPFHWVWILTGFALFRLFDIWKPHPIKWVESRVGGGLGIMLDDVIAAVPAFFILQILSHLYTPGGG